MTKISKRKPVNGFWETACEFQYKGGATKPVVVAISPEFVELKFKGTRETYQVTWASIMRRGIEIAVAAKGKP